MVYTVKIFTHLKTSVVYVTRLTHLLGETEGPTAFYISLHGKSFTYQVDAGQKRLGLGERSGVDQMISNRDIETPRFSEQNV